MYKITVLLVTNPGNVFKTLLCDLTLLKHQLSLYLYFSLIGSGVKYTRSYPKFPRILIYRANC